ncbi:tetratricopeptide repeat protein [Kitasatospora sp. KL5]|uniref:tetratricopeptide repeat protein n=1 Tax=Kitasatospora sp. KL5 TaxID=3425125 RepID=UPI003D701190
MTADESAPKGVEQHATASGNGRVNQVAGDQHNTYITQAPSHLPQALAALPAAPAHLVGRRAEVDELLAALTPGSPAIATPGASVVVAGLAGIGKTALALHAAHQAAEQGMFPGGILYVSLDGYDPVAAVSAERALGILLRQLGIRDEDLPGEVEELAALYQSELARRARDAGGVLIVADNASSPAQLTHLVPAHRAHRLLATSRDTLTSPALPARLLRLDELEAGDAAELIRSTVTRTWPEDRRTAAEPDALARVVALCGRLPLALQIAAAMLTSDPGLPVATLAEDLADTLNALQLPTGDTDGQSLAVRAAFDLSYRRLAPEPARTFRLLGLCAGPDLATASAAALTDRPGRDTRKTLAAIAAAGLLTEHPVGSGRWRMHDLIRLYTAELTTPCTDEDHAALDRLLKHYTRLAHAADDHLSALPGNPTPPHFDNRAQALAWLDAEHPVLVATTTSAAVAARQPTTAIHLAFHLYGFLHLRRHFDDAITTSEHDLALSHNLGDRHGEGQALNRLGNTLQAVRRFDDAINAHTQVLAIFTDLGDRHNEAMALNNLGIDLREVRRFDDAINAHTQALAIFTDLGDRHGEGSALTNLGVALKEVRRFDDAIDAHNRAADIFNDLGNRHNEGQALTNLGLALQEVRRFDDAIDAHNRAADIFTDLGNRHNEGQALTNLGLALQEVGRFDDAIDAHNRAADIFTDLGNRHGKGQALNNLGDRYSEGSALTNLGVALMEVGRFDDAIDAHNRALAIYRDLGDRHGEGSALTNLGVALMEVGRFDDAIDAHNRALAIYRDLGDRHSEGSALTNLGVALMEVGRFDDAIDAHNRALAIYRDLGDRHSEGKALTSIGLALMTGGRFDGAIDALNRAADIFTDLGDRPGEGMALTSLGLALQLVGRFDDAIDALNRAAGIFTDLGDRYSERAALTSLGLALQLAGRFDDARQAFTQAAIFADLSDHHGEE